TPSAVMRFAPVARVRGQRHWIEPRDYSARQVPLAYNASGGRTGLLRRASIDLDEPVSGHPALPARPGGWQAASLSRLVKSVYRASRFYPRASVTTSSSLLTTTATRAA